MPTKRASNPDTSNRGRITARITADKQAMLQLAADLSGSTLNQFIVQSALQAAEHVIEQEEVIRSIRLTVDQSKRFFEALDTPAEPNEALKQAMKRFQGRDVAS